MTWTPPETAEETAKRLLIPKRLYIRHLYRRALRRGEPELHLLPHLASRARLSVDVGANKGVYAYGLLPYSRAVHAFEPNPKLFRILQSWAEGRVVLHEAALSDRTGSAELLVPLRRRGYSNQGASLSRDKVTGPHGTVAVEAFRLDDLGLEDVGFMKIDVEGAQLQVLAGAARTIERDTPNLLIEIEEQHSGQPLEAMIDEVCGYGYACYALQNGTLKSFRLIDVERYCRAPEDRAHYIFNFVFLPR
jgi:FkbM family methyltransferase